MAVFHSYVDGVGPGDALFPSMLSLWREGPSVYFLPYAWLLEYRTTIIPAISLPSDGTAALMMSSVIFSSLDSAPPTIWNITP